LNRERNTVTRENAGCKAMAAGLLAAFALLAQTAQADSRDALFGDADDLPKPKSAAKPEMGGTGLKGFVQFELARTVADPEHWSKLRTRGEFGSQGNLGSGMKWKASVRLDYDAVFEVNDFYPGAVARNQRATAMLRETYIDVGAGDWDFRLGRQHVVWGEMVGLYFADVVSARDLREFILPEFEMQRTPQWAARAEYFKDDFHAELLWVPVASYDEIGRPGAEFYPYQPVLPGLAVEYRNEVKPARTLRNGNYGLRFSTLKNGWDLSAFYYRSMDIQQTFYREITGSTVHYEPRHDRISQLGGALTKDFGSVVLKGEAVHTRGRKFGVVNPLDADGVAAQNTLDWALGLDFSLPADTRFNAQLFQRVFFDHDPNILSEKRENGYSLYLNKKLGSKWEAQATLIASLNRTDGLFRPRVQWNFEKNWRLLAGFDFFKGPPLGMFGRYANRDRFYSEVRYSF
jgi:hypothetical protein